MKEELVSFEIAKLAKEIGFAEECYYYYNSKGKLIEPYKETTGEEEGNRTYLTDYLEDRNHAFYNYYSSPIQSLLQKWLREKYNIHITIIPWEDIEEDCKIWFCSKLVTIKNGNCLTINECGNHNSYEKALERALHHTLMYIIDGK